MNIRLHIESHIVGLVYDGDFASLGSKIIINAKHLGVATFHVRTKNSISSYFVY